MDTDSVQGYFLSLPEATLDFPFGPDVYVYKVCGRMFATLGWSDGQPRINLKCDPEQAVFLRETFASVVPGYHMNKTHWNTVYLDGSVPTSEIERMIDVSFALVVRKLRRADRQRLEVTHGKEVLYRGLGGALG